EVLAWRDGLEERESEASYREPTGDPETDRLFGQIRKDEISHSMAIQDMTAGGAPGPDTGSPEGRLQRILGRETWHQRGSSWISGAVYGANDGLAAVFGIVAGVSGARGGARFVLEAGPA